MSTLLRPSYPSNVITARAAEIGVQGQLPLKFVLLINGKEQVDRYRGIGLDLSLKSYKLHEYEIERK